MADSAISALTVSTSPSVAAVGVIADTGVDYKISIPNLVKAGGGIQLSVAQVSGSLSITSTYTSGSSVYGPSSALVIGTGTFGTLSRVSIYDDGTNAIIKGVAGAPVQLISAGGSYSATLSILGAFTLSSGAFVTGSSSYGPTLATVNGGLTIAGALSGATTGGFSGIVTASRFNGSGAGLTTATVPNAALVTSAVTAVTASGGLTSSGGLTPNLTINATQALTSITLSTPLAVVSGGTGSSTQNFVDLTSNQTISGTKSFTGTVNIPGTAISAGTLNIGTGGVQTGVLPIANGGTAASTLLSSPFAVLNPSTTQTGALKTTLAMTSNIGFITGSSTYGATSIVLSNGATYVSIDYGVTTNGLVNFSQPINYKPQYSFMRNKLMNGSFMIDQRNQGAVVQMQGGVYNVDRWYGNGASGKCTVQQAAFSATNGLPCMYALEIVSESAYTPASGDKFGIDQPIEANNIQELDFGNAAAKSVTLSFWAYTTLPGTYGGALQNYAGTRSYTFSYSLPSATVWTYITVTIPGDTAGTWVNSGNSGSLVLHLNTGCGSTGLTAANVWTSGLFFAPPGITQLVSTSGALIYFMAVQLETGINATPFEQRLYGAELALCQRYCWVQSVGSTYNLQAFGAGVASTQIVSYTQFPTTMRSQPTLAYTGSWQTVGSALACSAPSLQRASTDAGETAWTSSGVTTGAFYIIQGAGASATALIWSADL
jgi:hypothetical protein